MAPGHVSRDTCIGSCKIDPSEVLKYIGLSLKISGRNLWTPILLKHGFSKSQTACFGVRARVCMCVACINLGLCAVGDGSSSSGLKDGGLYKLEIHNDDFAKHPENPRICCGRSSCIFLVHTLRQSLVDIVSMTRLAVMHRTGQESPGKRRRRCVGSFFFGDAPLAVTKAERPSVPNAALHDVPSCLMLCLKRPGSSSCGLLRWECQSFP